MKHIFRCNSCKIYTMKEICPRCSQNTLMPKPAKYSIEDKYGSYRRKALNDERTEKGLI